MSQERPTARKWTLQAWYEQNTRWMELPIVDGEVFIHPQEVQASEPHTWTVTYTVGKDVLRAGAHVALEIPDGWSLDLGRPIQMERMVAAAPGEGMIGRAALVTVQSSSRNVRTDLAVSAASRPNEQSSHRSAVASPRRSPASKPSRSTM